MKDRSMPDYAYTTLPGPSGASSITPTAINDSGVVAGNYVDENGDPAFFIDSGGSFTALSGPSGAQYISPTAINASGEVVGDYEDGNGNGFEFIYSDGAFTTFAGPSGASNVFINSVNASGELTGTYEDGNAVETAFIDDNGTYTTIAAPSGAQGIYPVAINASGEVAGAYDDSDGHQLGFIYYNGVFTTLSGPQGAAGIDVDGFNDSGEVVIDYYESDGSANGQLAAIYSDGVYTALPGPAGAYEISPYGINNSGEVIASYSASDGASESFVYDNGVYDTPTGPLGTRLGISAINNSGQITGVYYDSNGDQLAYEATPLCYLRGTRILTPIGAVAIEDIRIGDPVVTRFSGIRPVLWIGRQSYDARFVRDNRDQLPIHIRPGALGDRMPARDLYVSPGHSMLVDGHLVLAKFLINGITITQEPDEAPERIDYFMLDLGTHDCVIAEGAWSESFADGPGLRDQFHNAAEFHALYPDTPPVEDLALCAPRPEQGAKLDAVLRPVVARAATGISPRKLRGAVDAVHGAWKISGWAQDPDHPGLPILLEIRLGGRVIGTILARTHRPDLAKAGIGQGNCAFFFTSPERLRPELLDTLSVRRAADGTELVKTPSCLEKIAVLKGEAPDTYGRGIRLVA
jgi:hypothetical protein